MHSYQLVTSLVKLSEGLQGLSEFLSSAYLGDHSFTALEKTATAAEETPVSISKAVSISKEKTPESGAETEEKKTLKKEHKKRAPKDPNAPKHPTSAYLLFQNDQRATLKAEHAELSNTELMQLISSKWKAMTEEQRKVCLSISECERCLLFT